jgi:hypothetical protein
MHSSLAFLAMALVIAENMVEQSFLWNFDVSEVIFISYFLQFFDSSLEISESETAWGSHCTEN